jgi:hypothetical protein
MSDAGPIRRFAIPIFFLGVTALGLINVYGDASEVERLAEETACGKVGCAVQRVEARRTPFSHYYAYQLSLQSTKTSGVECAREFVLVGDYGCTSK